MVGKVGNALETVSGNDGQFVRHSTLYSVDMRLCKRYGHDIPCQLVPINTKDEYRSRELNNQTLVTYPIPSPLIALCCYSKVLFAKDF